MTSTEFDSITKLIEASTAKLKAELQSSDGGLLESVRDEELKESARKILTDDDDDDDDEFERKKNEWHETYESNRQK